MYEFHGDMKRYHDMTREVTEQYVIPFVSESIDVSKPLHVLEIGSGEAGVLSAFTARWHHCVGVELSPQRVERAKALMEKEVKQGLIQFIAKDIYDIDPNQFQPKFDLIILKDVIEHIHEQEKIMVRLKDFLAPNGIIFFGFPPWYMPYGGHQQVAKSKVGSKLPYYHILPKFLYKGMLKMFGESEAMIEGLEEIKDTGISIERFERITKSAGLEIVNKTFYLFNPIYKFKFGLKPRKQLGIVNYIPFLRNFVTTCAYYTVKVK
ncbi:MAG: class I SAM-dependent methyltransferase [Bacteroidetes bacterium]|jgi:2-polyprenyl-3-methyl-5-hydroxy-6-metoxy-1,4-benzoquinol methylase|nr:class I SAM-dependent methyltransferase [Bacteroidota bacterium]